MYAPIGHNYKLNDNVEHITNTTNITSDTTNTDTTNTTYSKYKKMYKSFIEEHMTNTNDITDMTDATDANITNTTDATDATNTKSFFNIYKSFISFSTSPMIGLFNIPLKKKDIYDIFRDIIYSLIEFENCIKNQLNSNITTLSNDPTYLQKRMNGLSTLLKSTNQNNIKMLNKVIIKRDLYNIIIEIMYLLANLEYSIKTQINPNFSIFMLDPTFFYNIYQKLIMLNKSTKPNDVKMLNTQLSAIDIITAMSEIAYFLAHFENAIKSKINPNFNVILTEPKHI